MLSPSPPTHRKAAYLTAPLLAVLVSLCAAPAHADDASEVEAVSAAEHFTGLLTEEPEGAAVVVHESVAGDGDPVELEQNLHDSFGRLDVPYYVVTSAVPSSHISGDDFLAAVQDRVGEPGVYVLLRPRESRVYAVTHEVDLPVDDASRALSRERAFTYSTPVDVQAEAFVDALRAPDLDERTQTNWFERSPMFWLLDPYVQGIRLNTHDGPERLGTATAFVVGLTVALSLALGTIHTRRRGRAKAAGYTGRLPGDRALVVGGVLLPTVGAVVMVASLVHLNTATLPRDTEKPRPLPPETAPYVASTVRVDRVAEELRDEPLYVDPLARDNAGDLAEVAERLDASDVPVYVAVVPMSTSDESDGETEILAHALHHVMGEDGAFVVVDSSLGKDPHVGAALFGLSHEEESSWDAELDVTGLRSDLTTERAVDEYLDMLEGVSAAPGEESAPPYSVERRANPTPEPSRTSEFFSEGFFGALFLGGPLTALALLGAVLAVQGATRPVWAAPGRSLRPRADRAVRRASKALHTISENHPGRDEALRETDAAMAVLSGEPDELDLVGVTVLADRAVRRLDPDPDTAATADAPVCEINPLHGPAVTRGSGSAHSLCATCAALTSNARSRATLRVATPSGERRPHHELDRRWVTTGYGAKDRLDVEDLLKETDVH